MAFEFMRNSECAYQLAIVSLSHMACDENKGSSVAELNARAVRLLKLAAIDYYPAKQMLTACYMENLVGNDHQLNTSATPTVKMLRQAHAAKRKEQNACGVL